LTTHECGQTVIDRPWGMHGKLCPRTERRSAKGWIMDAGRRAMTLHERDVCRRTSTVYGNYA